MQFCGHHTESLTIWKIITHGPKFANTEWNGFFTENLFAIKNIHDSGYLHNDIK